MEDLHILTIPELSRVCKKFNIAISGSQINKTYLITLIRERYNQIRKYKKYTYIQQLGREGKDGRTFCALSETGQEVAIKIFSTTKNSKSIEREAKLQMIAAQHGIAPQIIEYDPDGKYIVMEKLDTNLFDLFKQQNGSLTRSQQKSLIQLFQALDKCKVFHGDPNPLNFMSKNGKWYVIDFGFSKPINKTTIPRYGETPNMTYMPLGFKLKLQKIYDQVKLDYIERFCNTS
jgi:predicted Ser/Thr protein kinase